MPSRAGANIIALDSSSGHDLNMVRLVISKPREGARALERLGYIVTQATVLGIPLPHKPRQLATLTRTLAKAGLNIDYMYASALDGSEQALVVFHMSDIEAAERALKVAAKR